MVVHPTQRGITGITDDVDVLALCSVPIDLWWQSKACHVELSSSISEGAINKATHVSYDAVFQRIITHISLLLQLHVLSKLVQDRQVLEDTHVWRHAAADVLVGAAEDAFFPVRNVLLRVLCIRKPIDSAVTMRTILCMPNAVRAWRSRLFYLELVLVAASL